MAIAHQFELVCFDLQLIVEIVLEIEEWEFKDVERL